MAKTTELPPLPFASDAFRAVWTEFEQHRREIGHKLTPTSARRLFAKFAKWGEARSIAAIGYSIEQGWQGVFEEKGTRAGGGRQLVDEMKAHGDAFESFMEGRQ